MFSLTSSRFDGSFSARSAILAATAAAFLLVSAGQASADNNRDGRRNNLSKDLSRNDNRGGGGGGGGRGHDRGGDRDHHGGGGSHHDDHSHSSFSLSIGSGSCWPSGWGWGSGWSSTRSSGYHDHHDHDDWRYRRVVVNTCPSPAPVIVRPCPEPAVVVVDSYPSRVIERPLVIERPVIVDKPVVVEREVVVERPVIVNKPVEVRTQPQPSSYRDRELGDTYLRMGDFTNAVRVYGQYVATVGGKQDGTAVRNYGFGLLATGKPVEGVQNIASAYRIEPDMHKRPLTVQDLGGVRPYTQLLDASARAAETLNSSEAWLTLAILHNANNQRDAAVASIQKARDAGLATDLLDGFVLATAAPQR